MAERRMFSKTVIDSDTFLDMPPTTQNLYFHLSMRADDDGFVNSPKKIQRMVGANEEGHPIKGLCAAFRYAYNSQDPKLWSMAEYYSSGLKHTSLAFFRDTGTSSVEAAAIKHLDRGAYT